MKQMATVNIKSHNSGGGAYFMQDNIAFHVPLEFVTIIYYLGALIST